MAQQPCETHATRHPIVLALVDRASLDILHEVITTDHVA
jgi:hypothetical protein